MLLTITYTLILLVFNCSYKHLCTQTYTHFSPPIRPLCFWWEGSPSFLLSKCPQSFLPRAPYINTGHIHTHKNGSSMLTDWAGLTLSPSLPMGGTIQARRRHTHTHTLPDLEQPPLTDRSATVLSRKPCLPWDTWLPTENTHIHTECPECACIHTHTLENFLPAYTTHKYQA